MYAVGSSAPAGSKAGPPFLLHRFGNVIERNSKTYLVLQGGRHLEQCEEASVASNSTVCLQPVRQSNLVSPSLKYSAKGEVRDTILKT